MALLAPGEEPAFELPSGELTVSVESVEFNASVFLLDAGGAVLASDLDSGSLGGAWLRVDADRPDGCRVAVRIENEGGAGRFLITAHAGELPQPAENEADVLVRIFTGMAEAESARGNLRQAHQFTHRLGELLFQRNEHALAGPVFRRAIELGEAIDNTFGAAVDRAFLGAVERRIGSDEAAVVLLEAALADIDQAQVRAFILENLGQALVDLKRHDEAFEVTSEFQQLTANGGPAGIQALAHSRLGVLHMLMGDAESAAASHQAAVALLPGIERDEDVYLAAQVWLAVGKFKLDLGLPADAEPLFRKALELEPNPEDALAINGHLGGVLTAQGRYGEARRHLQQVRLQLAGRQDMRYSLQLLDDLAYLEWRLGNVKEARQLTEQALVLAVEQGDVEAQANLISDLGAYSEQAGDFELAGRRYERAEALWEAAERPGLGWKVQVDLGRLLHKQGRYLRALERDERALAMVTELGDQSGEATILNHIAWTNLHLGRIDLAREYGHRSRALHEQTGERDRLLPVLHTLAGVELAYGDLDAVAALIEEADAIFEREDITSLPSLTAAGVRSEFTSWGEVAQDLVVRRLAEPGADKDALLAWGAEQAGRWKARALLEGLPRPALLLAGSAPLTGALGPERALVEYVRGSDDLYAYVLVDEGFDIVELGPADDLDEAVTTFVGGMSDLSDLAPAEDIARQGRALFDRLMAPLIPKLGEARTLVLVPTPELARIPFEALVMAVDGDGSSFDELQFVGDEYALTYGPSVPVLERLAALGARRDAGRVLVVGDPRYEGDDGGEDEYARLVASKGEVFSIAEALLLRLPSDDPGAQSGLATLPRLSRERSGVLQSAQFDLYFGDEATADRLSGDLGQYSVIHIAAHGEVDAEDPLRSGLVLARDSAGLGYLSLADIQELELDADMVVLSACQTATGRVLKGEGVQSLARAFLEAGSRSVLASLWNVEDEATRRTMSQFYESLLLDGRTGSEALKDARSLRDIKQRLRQARGGRLGERVPRNADPGHPYFWAPFIYVGAIPADVAP